MLQQLVNGVSSSALLFVVSIGIVIIMGHMKVVNLAHGECIMLGAYISYYMGTVLKVPFVLTLPIAFALCGLFGVAIERIVIRKLYGKEGETLLVTYGISLFLQQAVNLLCGSDLKYVKLPMEGIVRVGGIVIPHYNIFTILVAVIVGLMTLALLYRTRFGMRMRATTGNRQITECLGINTALVDTVTFGYGVALAGLAGAVLAPIKGVSPFMGIQYLTDAFMNVVVGGLSSLFGTTLSSALIGESRNILGGYINEVNASMIVFLIVIVVIRIRPEGLFSRQRR
ncbi:MAG: urea ABC transporter permease subunit UrtB [Clostridiales Family XIII bacterium]|nr:urea ABC transporter permease subunit UrtB [Clostridiales Family XIII bacterium]